MKYSKLLLRACIFCCAIIIIIIPLQALAWRIEKGNILVIEKGDNLWDIAHSLYAKGYEYPRIWKGLIDSNLTSHPEHVLQDMQFRLDSLPAVLRGTSPASNYPLVIIKDDPPFSFWKQFGAAILAAIVTIGCVFISVWRNNEVSRKNQRIQRAFDMHREFNGEEMLSHRRKGDEFLVRAVKDKSQCDIQQLSSVQDEAVYSVFVVFHFYNRLWVANKNKQIHRDLLPELFGQIFCYWYTNCFSFNIDNVRWQSAGNIKEFYEWMASKEGEAKWTETNTDVIQKRLSAIGAKQTSSTGNKIPLTLNGIIDTTGFRQEIMDQVAEQFEPKKVVP